MAFTKISGDWANWAETGTWTGGTTTEITAAQFLSETGESVPSDHLGTVMKVVLTLAATEYQFRLTSPTSEDVSSWVTICPRYYVDPEIKDRFDKDGYCKFLLLDGSAGKGEMRGAQGSLSEMSQRGFNFHIVDPNVDNSSWELNDTNNNYGWRLTSFDNADVETYQFNIKTDTAGDGFVDPLTIYLLDVLRDVGQTPIKICIGWDDNREEIYGGAAGDNAETIDELAAKYRLKQISYFNSNNVDTSEHFTTAEILEMQATGRWEFTGHASTHTDYEIRSGGSVDSDMTLLTQDMRDRGMQYTRSFKVGSAPTNAHERTSDGALIQDIHIKRQRKASRRGHGGAPTSELLGAASAYELGAFVFGQALGTQMDDHAQWTSVHAQMKLMGCSYILYGHDLADDKGSAGTPAPTGTQIAYTELEKIFSELRDDIHAGTVEVVFFGQWCEDMGIDLGFTAQRPLVGHGNATKTRPTAGTRPVAGTRPLAGTRVAA